MHSLSKEVKLHCDSTDIERNQRRTLKMNKIQFMKSLLDGPFAQLGNVEGEFPTIRKSVVSTALSSISLIFLIS